MTETMTTLQEKIRAKAEREARQNLQRFQSELHQAFRNLGITLPNIAHLREGGMNRRGELCLRVIRAAVNDLTLPELITLREEAITEEILNATAALRELEEQVEDHQHEL